MYINWSLNSGYISKFPYSYITTTHGITVGNIAHCNIPDCRVWHFLPRSRVRKAQAVHFQVRKIIFRCGKMFAGKAQVHFECGSLRCRR